jgi:hypothetical protein
MKEEDKYANLTDARAERRDRKKKKTMPVDGAFLKQVARIQNKRLKELEQQRAKEKP